MTTLYRKYRPSTFGDVSDQEHVVTTIQNEIIHGTIAHAYLFSGPRGVGKTTTARLLAKAVNCTDRKKASAEPCNACSACTEINAGRHIDVIEIDAASQTGVDNVRENIIENAQFKPTTAKYKVFIVDEVHMLSPSAFNALLKTLEEPPAHVVFILATTELHKLPATVISRCQRFHFKKIRYEQMLERLQKICREEKISVEQDVLDRIIVKSDGCLRDAESLLGQIFSLNLKKISAKDAELVLPTSDSEVIVRFVEHLLKKEAKEAIMLLHQEMDAGQAPDQFAYTLIELLRVLLVVKTIGDTKLYQAEYSDTILKKIQELGKETPPHTLIKLIDLALERRLNIKTSPLPQLPLELLAAEAALLGEQPPAATVRLAVAEPEKKTLNSINPAPQTAATRPEITQPSSAPIAETPPPTITLNSSGTITSTLEQIKTQWNTVVEKISDNNRSLTFILKMCVLKEIANNRLVINVPYSFHKEKVEESKSKRAIEQALEALLNERILIVCDVEQQMLPKETDVNELAMAFGGQVVD